MSPDLHIFSSIEPWEAWQKYIAPQVDNLELHVPCRDPIDHLLSMCNHRGIQFQCDLGEKPKPLLKGVVAKSKQSRAFGHKSGRRMVDINDAGRRQLQSNPNAAFTSFQAIGDPVTTEEQIEACLLVGMDRFHSDLSKISHLKCFSTSATKNYMEFMGNVLQPRRNTEDFVIRESNRPRDKESECLPKAPFKFQQGVVNYLLEKYHYYQFCNSCIGTEWDKFASA
jgi:hypothetical protein